MCSFLFAECIVPVFSVAAVALALLLRRSERTNAASRGSRQCAERKAEAKTAHGAGPRRATGGAGNGARTPAAQLNAKADAFDAARSNLYTTIGTTSDTMSHATIEALPGSTNTPVERLLLQFPGVSQDSAVSGDLHVRNDHANVQYRINGILLPDGLTGFSSVLDAKWIGSLALVTGALPAEFGLRTVGLVDITTRTDLFNNSGNVGVYGGSQGTLTPSFDYGGTFGSTCPSAAPAPGKPNAPPPPADCFAGVQYYFTGRYLQTNEGIENPTSNLQPHPRFLAAGKGLCLHVDVHRPDNAAQPDRGNGKHDVSNSQRARSAGWIERKSSGHERLRCYQFQFCAA